jgi:hypothetical protein
MLTMLSKYACILSTLLLGIFWMIPTASSFSLTMMGTRRGKGGMKIDAASSSKSINSPKSQIASLNNGRGQEITGVSLPAPGESQVYLDNLQTAAG